jgi:hypothetical protein
MIVLFSQYPLNIEKAQPGNIQRTLAIDSLLKDSKRAYLNVSYTKHFTKQMDIIDSNLSVYRYNAFIHFFHILKHVLSSRVIYMHTIGNGLKYFPYAIFRGTRKAICDMHGVLPEEARHQGNIIKSYYYKFVEIVTLRSVDIIVCVSKNMIDHYANKYSTIASRFILLPIFTPKNQILGNHLKRGQKGKTEKISIVYAGGIQKWQNIEDMIAIIKNSFERNNNIYNFTMWLPEASINNIASLLSSISNYSLRSGSIYEVHEDYRNHSMGLILRDEHLLNRVSCPTKMVEYIQHGIVPIMKSINVGDFNKMGLKFYIIKDIEDNASVLKDSCQYAEHNLKVYEKFIKQIDSGIRQLIQVLNDSK